LYTSEGCHSCPPADRWLTDLKQQKNLWKDFIPLSFHVDYWDYIGWDDKYASKQFSRRQRAYAAEFRERTVYTPAGMRLLGHEWRTWRRANPLFMSTFSKELKTADIGVLSLKIDKENQFSASFDSVEQQLDSQLASDYIFNIAVLGVDVVSKIEAGENRGKTLKHDFVVLGMESHKALKGQGMQWSGGLPDLSNPAPRYAVVAWIAERNSLIPKQAVGAYLENLEKEGLKKEKLEKKAQ